MVKTERFVKIKASDPFVAISKAKKQHKKGELLTFDVVSNYDSEYQDTGYLDEDGDFCGWESEC